MKPIIRILLYLEEKSHEPPEIVQEAYDVVQECYDKYEGGDARKNMVLTGAIFEMLIERLRDRVNLTSVFQEAQTLGGPKLNAYFSAPDAVNRRSRPAPFFPTLLQLAVAYGAYSSREGSSSTLDMEAFVRAGAKAVSSMSTTEKVEFWNSVA